MRGTGGRDAKWNVGVRWIPGIPVERAQLRLTATYAVAPGAFVGLEYNPKDDDLGVLANWRLLEETERRPMLMIGTSSDRIGTPDGRAYYATLSKSVEDWTGLPIAPYAGTSYGTFDDEFVAIGGLGVRWHDDWVSTHSWDGHNVHHVLEHTLDERLRVGFVLAEQDHGHHYGGVSLGVTF